MPIIDTDAQNASLANDYGTTRGPNAAATHEVALLNADPRLGGTEITGTGYIRATIVPADWSTPVGGATSAHGTFGTPTGDWDQATHWALIDPATSTMWDADALDEPLTVSAGGTAPTIIVTVYHPDALPSAD